MVYLCHPRNDDGVAETARMEDAVCANHPTKKAVTVCAGSGDYICALCRVHIGGKDYSVQYLDHGGKPMADQLFAQRLPRPERLGLAMLLLNALSLLFLSPFFLVLATISLVKSLGLRKTNSVYEKIMRPAALWLCWLGNLVMAAIGVLIHINTYIEIANTLLARMF